MPIQLNIIYHDHHGEQTLIYKSESGEVYYNNKHNDSMINIGMNWHSNQYPKKEDGLLILEPFCVNGGMDYDLEFHKQINKIFTWSIKPLENTSSWNKVIEINHPCYHILPDIKNLQNNWPAWNYRSNKIVFIASDKSSNHFSEIYSLRLQLADLLFKYSKYEVEWYGQIPVDKPYYKGQVESKENLLKNVKFSVCTENCYDPIYSHNYFTEKMPDVWLAGCVPIYMGCYNIDEFGFNDHSYIDLRTYCQKINAPQVATINNEWKIDIDSLIARIEGYDEPRYIGNVQGVVDTIDNLYHHVSYARAFETMLKSYSTN